MLTRDIRNQVDTIWSSFWTGGISNPLEVIEQITYLLFLRRLDELQTVEELAATRLKKPMERRIFPEGADPRGKPYDEMRWSRFKNTEARAMFETISEHVFPWLRVLGGDGSTYARHMKDARFTIPTPQLLAKVSLRRRREQRRGRSSGAGETVLEIRRERKAPKSERDVVANIRDALQEIAADT
jgi:type I restriction enzyme M protein